MDAGRAKQLAPVRRDHLSGDESMPLKGSLTTACISGQFNMSSHHVDFPTSHRTVRVRMVDTTTVMTIQAESFVEPVQRGHEVINITDVAFLIEHEPSGKKVMFDLGCRKDYWNLPAVIQKWLGRIIPALQVEKDTSEILEERGIDLKSISQSIPAFSSQPPLWFCCE